MKPRLFICAGTWHCWNPATNDWRFGRGETPTEAYDDWKRKKEPQW